MVFACRLRLFSTLELRCIGPEGFLLLGMPKNIPGEMNMSAGLIWKKLFLVPAFRNASGMLLIISSTMKRILYAPIGVAPSSVKSKLPKIVRSILIFDSAELLD